MAATFSGEFWDADGTYTLAHADSVIATQAVTATFRSTAIDYPNGDLNVIADTSALSTFLGADAGTLSGAGSVTMNGSVFRFTGLIDLLVGQNTFSVGSDDGYRLIVAGVMLGFANSRAFATDTLSGDFIGGLTNFELIYFENGGSSGVEFFVNGNLASPSVANVPLPAALPLLAAALGGLVLMRRHSALRAAHGSTEPA